ncbi:WXG100-like domain-containing protein [Amycolatopsis pigmentata]|uniref:Outer membrane channel protein CpnT-like N-terminal domain-containing protein n=1 Tax=Amycolatopsis pigmentata TaxID=450801 RepID=A0ABW5G1J7_9PSEU
MALMVSDEARLWFLIVTGDEFPDANEDSLRALCAAWRGAASGLRGMALDLRRAVAAIRDGFQGQAAAAFAAVMSPFVDGQGNYLDSGAAFFDELGEMLCELALDVEYMKYVIILELSTLAAEFAWATAMSAFFGPVPMVWFSSRLQMVRRLFRRLMKWFRSKLAFLDKIGWAGRALLAGMVTSMGNQMVVAVGAQAIQFAQHKRDHWTKEYLSDAAVVGAVGGFLALPVSALGHRISRTLTTMLDSVFGRAHSFRDWHKAFADGLAHVLHESLHEGSTATISTAILTHQFAVNWADFTAGASSGVGRVAGHLFGHIILKLANLAGISLIAHATNRAVKKRLARGGGHGDDIEYKPVPVPRSYNDLSEGPRDDAPADDAPADGPHDDGGRRYEAVPRPREYDRSPFIAGTSVPATVAGTGHAPARGTVGDFGSTPAGGLAGRNEPLARSERSTVDNRVTQAPPQQPLAQQPLVQQGPPQQGPPQQPLAQRPLAQQGPAQQGLAQQGPPQTEIGKTQLEPKATAPELTSGPSWSQQQAMPVTASAGQSLVTPAQQAFTGHQPGGTPKSWEEVGKFAEHIEKETGGQLSRSTARMEDAMQIVRQTFRVGRLNAKQLDALALVVAYRRLGMDRKSVSRYSADTATGLGVPSSRWLSRLRFPGGSSEAAGLSHEDPVPEESAYAEEIQATSEAAEDAAAARDAAAVAVGRARFARAKAERDLTEAVESLRVATGGVIGTEAARETGVLRVAEARTALGAAQQALEAARAPRDQTFAAAGEPAGFEEAAAFRFDIVADFERASAFQVEEITAFTEAAAVEFEGAADFRDVTGFRFEDIAGFEDVGASEEIGAFEDVIGSGNGPAERAISESGLEATSGAGDRDVVDFRYVADSGTPGGVETIAGSGHAGFSEGAEGWEFGEEASRPSTPAPRIDVTREVAVVEEAQRRLDVAERYLRGTEVSAQAAREAERAATEAVEGVRRAVTRATDAHTAAAKRLKTANAAAKAARIAVDSTVKLVRDAVTEYQDAIRAFEADRSAVERLAREVEELERRITGLDQLAEPEFLGEKLTAGTVIASSRPAAAFAGKTVAAEVSAVLGIEPAATDHGTNVIEGKEVPEDKEVPESEEPSLTEPEQPARHRADPAGERADLIEIRDEKLGELDRARIAARESDERTRLARRELDLIGETVRGYAREAAAALDTTMSARSDAETSRDTAETAAADAAKAKGEAKSAAKQGQTEAMFTLLSSVPPGSLLGIEHLGSLDEVVAAVAEATGLPPSHVFDEISARGGEGLVDAMNERQLTIQGPDGPVSIELTAVELDRPADSRTKPSTSLPPAAFLRKSSEHTEPHSDGSSRNLPVRIPLMVFEPVTAALSAAIPIGVVRPSAFIGATGRGTRKFDSSGSITREHTSTDRPALDTRMALTFRRKGGKPVVATVDVGLRIAEVVRGTAESRTLTEEAVAALRQHGVDVPDDLRGKARISYVGTSPGWEIKTTTKQSRNASSSGGSDGTLGVGVFGGMQHDWGAWFVGFFGEVGNGLTGGLNRVIDREQIHNAVHHMLIYRIDAGETGYAVMPVHVARAAGLPLPENLQGRAKVSGSGARRYVFGTDDIAAVPKAKEIARVASQGLSETGRAAVEAEFGTPDAAHVAVSDAMYGGHQITWSEGDREHTLDVRLVPVPPEDTKPSGLMKLKLEDKTTVQWRRTTTSARSAKAGFGGEVRPVFDDNPDARKPYPEEGDPEPYQGAATSSRSLPAAAITANWDNTRAGKPGRLAKDARVSTYEGEFRDWDGTVTVYAVHSTTKKPNRFQRWVLGGMMTSFGEGSAGRRLTEPPRDAVEKAFAAVEGEPSIKVLPNDSDQSAAGVVRGTVARAIRVAVPVDKVDWASSPLPESTMKPGLYLGAPPRPPGDAVPINPAALGEYAAVEDVHVSRNHIEAVEIALAKRVFPISGPGKASRESPFLGGTWPAPGARRFTETRTEEGRETSTTYWYKMSSLVRLNNAARHAISQVLGRVSARGITALGLNGQSSGTGDMVQSGRISDLTGRLDVAQAHFAPRLVAVRAMGRLQRNQNGEAVVSSALNRSKGIGGRFNVSVVPKRLGKLGGNIRAGANGSYDRARNHVDEALPGNKQSNEYKGPTAFLVFDTRSTFTADMKIRNLFHTSTFDELPVTVDEPNGTVVQLPARHAAELYKSLGLPVPPELAAAVPAEKPPEKKGVPAQTLMPADGGYASHNGTNVINSVLHGDDPLAGVRARLDELGVKGEWRQRVLDQVGELLATPHGYVDLRNVLFGGGRTPIQVAASDVLFDDVVDVDVTAAPSDRPPATPAVAPLESDALINVGYLTTTQLDQTTTTKQREFLFETGLTDRTKAPVSPGHLGPDGTPVPGKPGTGAPQGSFAPRPTVGRTSRKQVIEPTSLNVKSTSQLKSDKVASDHREVTYSLRVSRRRKPMPGFETLALGVPDLIDWDRETTQPVHLPGAVDFSTPDRTVAPPLPAPANRPAIEVVATRPRREPLFRPDDGFHPEAIGRYTIEAVRKAVYALFSAKPLSRGIATPRAVDAAVAAKSAYTREGGAAEYVLNLMTSGTSLHGGLHAMATGEDYQTRNVVASKHVPFDKLFDLKLTLDYRSLEIVEEPPEGVYLEIIHEVETSRPYGSSKVEGHVLGETNPTMGSGDAPNVGDNNPVTVRTFPYAGGLPSHDRLVYATLGRTFQVQGTKYTGRFFLVKADADIYVETSRHKSNRVADLFSSPDRVAVVHSKEDLYVRIHEDLARRMGIAEIGDVWSSDGVKKAGSELAVTLRGGGLSGADLAELMSSDGESDFSVDVSEEGGDVVASLPDGSLLTELHGLPDALAFDETWDGAPPVASALAAAVPGSGRHLMNRAPVFTGRGGEGLVKVAGRLTEPGARAVVWVLSGKASDDGFRSGRAVNLVRSGNDLYLVDVPTRTVERMTLDDLREVGADSGPVYALVSDGEGGPLPIAPSRAPVAPGKDADSFDLLVYEDEKRKHGMRVAADNGEDIPLPGIGGRLTPWLGGLRLVASVVASPAFVAELSATLVRDVIALVIGPNADDPPRWLLFPPSGHPLPVKREDLPPDVQALL